MCAGQNRQAHLYTPEMLSFSACMTPDGCSYPENEADDSRAGRGHDFSAVGHQV